MVQLSPILQNYDSFIYVRVYRIYVQYSIFVVYTVCLFV